LDFSGPTIECEKIDCSEGIDGVDSYRYDERYPKITIGEVFEAGGGMEIIETLR
jgi:hypothetical protein